MRARVLWLLVTVVLLATIAACGPSEEEQSATATAMAAEAFATQTANAPTATNTPTPTPLPTDTPTATPTNTPSPTATPVPTNTPTPSPLPTPDYSNTGLTLADMPEDFIADTEVAEFFVVGQEGVLGVPSIIVSAFGFADEAEENIVFGFSARLDQADVRAFDQQIDSLNQLFLTSAQADADVESEPSNGEPAEIDDIGDIIANDSAAVTDETGDTYTTDVLTFRRGNVVTFLTVLQIADGDLALEIAELARLIDRRIMASSEATGSGQTAGIPENNFDLYAGLGEDAFGTTGSGLRYAILEEGDTGQQLQDGQMVTVHYTGYFEDGRSFDNSIARGEPFTFQLGQEDVIAGWEEGITLLKVGDKARLIIPSELAYGETGNQVIPANATLIFDVEILSVTDGPPEAPLEVDAADYVVTDSGLKYYDIVVGDGDSPAEGQLATMAFTIWLDDGTMLGSTLTMGQPAPATVGSGQLLPGWEEGLLSMKVGGSRQLVIPPELAFGAAGSPDGAIPPNATLIVEMELLAVEDGG